MERQLSVWAAPGLILFLALLAFVFGHPPGAAAPRAEAEVAAAPAEAPPAGPAAEPQELPKPQAKPAKPAEAKPPAVKPPDPEPEAAPAEPQGPATAPPPPAQETIAKTGDGPTGKVVGRIVYDGAPPEPRDPISVPEKQVTECCGAEMDTRNRSLLVSADGGVADVVVTIKAKGAEAAGWEVIEMDQKCCVFEPRVLLVQAGATVRFKNSDDATHNVHIDAKKNPKANNNLAAGSSMSVPVNKDDEMTITCDIHTWMKAHVIVAKYATAGVTGSDGRFEIDGVPPGEWAVDIWSERTRPVDKKLKVKVEAGATTTVEWRVAVGE